MLQQHEIIMMARQVGYTPFEALKWERALTNFAKLVAEKAVEREREALLDVVYGYARSLSWNEDFQADIRARGNPHQEVKHE